MYKFLIADEDKAHRDRIHSLLLQSKEKFEIYETDSLAEALRYIDEYKPDVILTDADEKFDGKQLITHADGVDRNTRVIIMSENDDFNTAVWALRNGVFDYILKPVQEDEFREALSRLLTDMEQERHRDYVTEHILYLAANGSDISDIEEYCSKRVSMDFLSEYHCIIMIDFNKDFFGRKGIDFKEHFVKKYSDDFTYLNLNHSQGLFFCKDRDCDYIRKAGSIMEEIYAEYGEWCFAAVSSVFDGADKIAAAMSELDDLMENKFYCSPGDVFYKGRDEENQNAVPTDDDTVVKQMKQDIKMKDMQGLRMHFDRFCQKYRNKTNFSQVYIKFLFANLLKDFNAALPERDENELNEEIDALYRATDFNTVIEVVNKNIDRLENTFSKNPQMLHREVEIVKQYIYEHYGEEISVEGLGEMVYMAPSYLSSIFKKETGQNLSKFIKAYRMERAKDLLENTMSKIVDVSVSCGYPNVSYFCQSFREYFGVSPQKYRECGEESENIGENAQKDMAG